MKSQVCSSLGLLVSEIVVEYAITKARLVVDNSTCVWKRVAYTLTHAREYDDRLASKARHHRTCVVSF